MSDIKAGQVALMRTTGEPTFVLAVTEDDSRFPELSGKIATVRRLTGGQNGLFYQMEKFAVEELETEESALNKKVSEAQEMKARFGFGKPGAFAGDVVASS